MAILSADYKNINFEEMAASIGLKAKHMPLLIASFLEESAPALVLLDASIASNDLEAISQQAHAIKGSAGNLRFNEVYEMAKDMEYSAKEHKEGFDYVGHLVAMKKAIETIPQ